MFRELKRDIKLILFCILIGAVAGGVICLFLKIMVLGKEFIWSFIPGIIKIPFYTILICFGGGLFLGNIHKKYGEFPESMNDVFIKLKNGESFEYRNLPLLAISAFVPLIIGSCVGPEAGLMGLVVTVWSWLGSHLKAEYRNDNDFSKLGIAVTLSILFQSPLFGVFVIEGEETNEFSEAYEKGVLRGKEKYALYAAAVGTGIISFIILSKLPGFVEVGLPSFSNVKLSVGDFVMMAIYIICGCIAAFFYYFTNAITLLLRKIPVMIREGIGGLFLGVIGTFMPVIMFSGSKEVGSIVNSYGKYLPLILIGIAFLKIFMANFCIRTGLTGGQFFPLIFAGIALGCGISSLFFGASDHMIFACAITTAALLGGVIRKPLAVTMLLAVCFPVKFLIWIFLAAAAGDRIMGLIRIKDIIY